MKKLGFVIMICLIAAAAVAFVPMMAQGRSVEHKIPDTTLIYNVPQGGDWDYDVSTFEDNGNRCYVTTNRQAGSAISCVPEASK